MAVNKTRLKKQIFDIIQIGDKSNLASRAFDIERRKYNEDNKMGCAGSRGYRPSSTLSAVVLNLTFTS